MHGLNTCMRISFPLIRQPDSFYEAECWKIQAKPRTSPHILLQQWDLLPQDEAIATNLGSLQRGLDKFMEDRTISGY